MALPAQLQYLSPLLDALVEQVIFELRLRATEDSELRDGASPNRETFVKAPDSRNGQHG